MSSDYFSLSPEVQKALLQKAADQLNISEVAIEKDIWVCWVLKQLFFLEVNMVFKGGTSLSKAYNLINRFSEDVDITVDRRNFMENVKIKRVSRSQLKKMSDKLKGELKSFIEKKVLPFLNEAVSCLPNKEKFNIEYDVEKGSLKFYYPSVMGGYILEEGGGKILLENGGALKLENYVSDRVLIEFGAINSIEPHEQHVIKTYLSQLKFEKPLGLPEATVDVLSAHRTFWEKATLIHVECHRKRLCNNPNKLSRHWYDLAMLIRAGVGKEALAKPDLLESVIDHKKAFYSASYTNYGDCLDGKFRLIPDKEDMDSLEQDYKKMIQSGMFSEPPMNFQAILEVLGEFEVSINHKSGQV